MKIEKGNLGSHKRNTAGTGDLLAFPLLGLLISALLCWVLKFRSKRTLIVQYQRSVSESTANGRVNMSATVAICMVGLLCAVGSIINTVSINHQILFYFINPIKVGGSDQR